MSKNLKAMRIGETSIASNGQTMTITVYRTTDDIDVMFEDGTTVKHARYKEFKKGYIRNPNKSIHGTAHSKRLGETNLNTYGQKMTIIKYRNAKDIDIMFEDGTIVMHKQYSRFKYGRIENPNTVEIINRTGETSIATNGQNMTITVYNNRRNITVKFDDGWVVESVSYFSFKKGKVSNPSRPLQNFPQTIGNMLITGIAYRSKNPNMFCECIYCHEKFIMTYDEMKEHTCKPNK